MANKGTLISVAGDQDGGDIRIVTERDPFPVHVTGVGHPVVNELFHLHTGINSTLASPTAIGATSIELVDATGFSVGDIIQINNGVIETTLPQITAIVTNTLTLDRPLDYAYSAGDSVEVVHADLSTTAGTLATPISHKCQPESGAIWDLERIILSMTHSSAAADDTFGNLAALTNGVLIRANVSGQFLTFTNWKTNRDIRLDMYDVDYTDKAGPSLFGTHGRGSFNRIGITVKLIGDNGDYLEALVQDDLTGLSSFLINGQGHIGR
jgi:hypothetical protein